MINNQIDNSKTQANDFARALYRLFFTKKHDKTIYKERQQRKLARALFFGQKHQHEKADLSVKPANTAARTYAKLQASLVGLNPEFVRLPSPEPSDDLSHYYQKKRDAYQSYKLKVEKVAMNGFVTHSQFAPPDKATLMNFNVQRAKKYYYKLLSIHRQGILGDELSSIVKQIVKKLKAVKEDHAQIYNHLKFQTLIYKVTALGAHDIATAEDKYSAQAQLKAHLTLLDELANAQTTLPHKVSYTMAKQLYRLLSYREFNNEERERLIQHAGEMIDEVITFYSADKTADTEKEESAQKFVTHIKEIAEDVPMTLDPETGIQGILNTFQDMFAWCVNICDKTYFEKIPLLLRWIIYSVPCLLKWMIFKPLEQAFAMFKRIRLKKDPHYILSHLLNATKLSDDDVSDAKKTIQLVVTREKFWRVFGYISAVAAAIGCGVVTAVALAALGGVPFLPVMVFGCLISGVIANYYLHKAYVPNTWVRFMEKGLFTTKGLNGAEIAAMWTGVVLALLASIAISAITYVGVNYALLLIGIKIGLFSISLSSLTFTAAAAPWLLTPMGLLVTGLLAVSIFIAFETFVTNFPIYIRDYTVFIRERKWKNIFNFFTNFFGNNKQSKLERTRTISYNTFLLFLVVGMSLSLGYFAMLPTSVAFGASVLAIVGIKWLYHGIVWGNMVANMPFVLQNIVTFCQRTTHFVANIFSGIANAARVLSDRSQREQLKQSLTWDNLMQSVREIAGIKDNATVGQILLGGFVFVGVIVTLFAIVVLNAFGNGKVGQEGGEIIAKHTPFYLSESVAEAQVVGQSTVLSYLFCYQAIFKNEDNTDPAFMSSAKVQDRASYVKLLQQCDAGGFEFKTPEFTNSTKEIKEEDFLSQFVSPELA